MAAIVELQQMPSRPASKTVAPPPWAATWGYTDAYANQNPYGEPLGERNVLSAPQPTEPPPAYSHHPRENARFSAAPPSRTISHGSLRLNAPQPAHVSSSRRYGNLPPQPLFDGEQQLPKSLGPPSYYASQARQHTIQRASNSDGRYTTKHHCAIVAGIVLASGGVTVLVVLMTVGYRAYESFGKHKVVAKRNTIPSLTQAQSIGIIAGSIAGTIVFFGLLTALALTLRKRRDRMYAARDAEKYATQLSMHTNLPIAVKAIESTARPLRALTPVLPKSLVQWGSEWLHSDRDDRAVRRTRRDDAKLQALSRLPTSVMLGHEASASAPDLLARCISHSVPANGAADGSGAEAREPVRESVDVPIVDVEQLAVQRGCVSMPVSRAGSVHGVRMEGVPEVAEEET